jgi:asparagine synthase (glutamine-hydrolysing)
MTAIAGIISLDQNPVDRDTVDRMVNQLKIYGRDAQHTHFEQGAAFLRTLLRITPEDSLDRQPLVHPPTRTLLLFDGRLDNREELAEALGITKPDLKLMADSDVALQACLRWDTAAVDQLLGDFAMACWNPRQRRLWLARDALGTRPLYWHKSSGFFAFATMPKGLFAIPGIQRAICEETLHDYLCLLPMIGPESFFKDVYRVEPGQFLVLDGSSVTTQRYHRWDPERELHLANDDEYLEAFREEVDRAVACRLRSTGLVASHLSSGFDSSTVTAVAARLLGQQGKPLLAYTAVPREQFDGPVPRGRHGDEGPGASALAVRLPNIEHHLVRTKGITPLNSLEKDIQGLDRPPLNPANRVWLRAIQEAAQSRGAKVLLTGDMGNMTISYAGMEYLAKLLSNGEWKTWWYELCNLKKYQPKTRWRGLFLKSWGPFLPVHIWTIIRYLRGELRREINDYTAIHPKFMLNIGHEVRVKQTGWDLSYRPWADGRKMRIAVLARHDLADYKLLSNLIGLDIRDPAMDRRLVEFCLAVPETQYLHRGQNRWLLRRFMDGVLPAEILEAHTTGYQAADWYESAALALPSIREELLRCNAANLQRYLDIESLEGLVTQWPKTGWGGRRNELLYRQKLLRGISVGAFVRIVESGND